MLLLILVVSAWSVLQADAQQSCFYAGAQPYPLDQGTCPTGFYVFGTSCMFVETTTKTWDEAQQNCIRLSSRLAWIETREKLCDVGRFIDTAAPNFPAFEYILWIGAKKTGPERYDYNWVESDDTLGDPVPLDLWHHYEPTPPHAFGAVIRNNFQGIGEEWELGDIFGEFPARSLCEIPLTDSATDDPHMLVHLPGVDIPVCFDYFGKDNDLVRMIHDNATGLTVDGELFAKWNSAKTFFSAVHVSVDDCYLKATYQDVSVNGKRMTWKGTFEYIRCGEETRFKVTSESELEIITTNGIKVIVTKRTKITKHNDTFEYVNLFVRNLDSLTSEANGLLGQFPHMEGEIHQGTSTKDAMLAFPAMPFSAPVPVKLHHRREPLTRMKISCWYVEDAALLIGDPEQYLVL